MYRNNTLLRLSGDDGGRTDTTLPAQTEAIYRSPPYLWTSHPENEGHRPRDNKGSLVAVDT
jgi:hypothetical protein